MRRLGVCNDLGQPLVQAGEKWLEHSGDGSGPEIEPEAFTQSKAPNPHLQERGTEFAVGFVPHKGENRRTRRAEVAKFVSPEGTAPRHALLVRRRQVAAGTLDPELRRLQKKKLQRKATK